MKGNLDSHDLERVCRGYDSNPARSHSLSSEIYIEEKWHAVDQETIIKRTWQWVCHIENLRDVGSFVTADIAGQPICIIRNKDKTLGAFFNVCKHRAMKLLHDHAGQTSRITCPYHGWTYDLGGQLIVAPATEHLIDFDTKTICLDRIQVEVFCGFVFVNLDPKAPSLASLSGALADEIDFWVPDIERLTFAKRLNYQIQANWKNVVDNFLECYHCPIAHKDFCTLVDMNTYKVTTHGIYSSHMAEAGKGDNSAYTVDQASVRDHAVWWLWPNTCLMRYPGRGNLIVMQIIPVSPGYCLETYDFFFETSIPTEAEKEAIDYLDNVLQAEDIWIVEHVQRGMSTTAFEQGRIIYDPAGSGKSEHAVHHFHGLVLEAYSNAMRS